MSISKMLLVCPSILLQSRDIPITRVFRISAWNDLKWNGIKPEV